jgi:S1-C subfamily serine protease
MRDGKEVALQGHWPAADKVIERRGVWVSGALFAEAEPLTGGLIAGAPKLMIHYVSPGSEAEAAGLVAFDLLMRVERTAVDSLDALLELAKRAAATDHPLGLVLLRLASEMKEDLFVHQQRTLSVTELETVGP